MSFTDLFIKRPVFATVVNLVILLVGIISFLNMPVRQFPKIDSSVITINTSYPGANPTLMEGFVTTPIEGAIAGVDGLDYITSSNTEGSSSITANFKLGYDMNAAVADVMNKVSSIRWQLPKNINDPVIQKLDPNADPVLFISFSSNQMSPADLNDYLVRVVQPVLQTIPGVGEAKIFGNLTYSMRLWLNPDLMAARNVTAGDVRLALINNNLQAATGRIKNATQEFNTTIKSDINNAKEFNSLVIKQNDHSLIRLQDIGYAELGTPEQMIQAYRNGMNTNVIGVIPRSTANPLAVTTLIKKDVKIIR